MILDWIGYHNGVYIIIIIIIIIIVTTVGVLAWVASRFPNSSCVYPFDTCDMVIGTLHTLFTALPPAHML
jgi:hypothetical protein